MVYPTFCPIQRIHSIDQYGVFTSIGYGEVLIRAIRLKKVLANKGMKLSMETFVPNDKADYYFGITSITVNGKNAYELKGKFLDDLHNNAFSGTNGKDAKMGGDEIEVSDDESSDLEEYWSNTEETVKIFKIKTYVFDYETPLRLALNEFNYLLKPWLDNGIWKEPKPVKHTCKPFNYKIGCSKWSTYSWREGGYFNGGNFLGAYHIGNSLHDQDLEWYEALEDSELKDEALRNKAIMEGLISDDESCNDCWKRWKSHEIYHHNFDKGECENETHEGHELSSIKTLEDLGSKEILMNIGGEFTNSEDLEVLES
ncbi:hypothetical protein Tco_0226180 [Tanacetum coccineum]